MGPIDRRQALTLAGAGIAAPAAASRAAAPGPAGLPGADGLAALLARRLETAAATLHADLLDDPRLSIRAMEAGAVDARAYLVGLQIGRLLEDIDMALSVDSAGKAQIWRMLQRQAAGRVAAREEPPQRAA